MWKSFLRKIARFSVVKPEPISYQLEIGSLTDTGRSRPVNQDYIGLFHSSGKRDFIAVVADGMGGHQAGDIASRLAVEEIQHNFFIQIERQSPERALRRVFEAANSTIYAHAQHSPEYQGMGTTLVALALYESAAYFAYTGDSRIYLVRENEIKQLTKDHTLVAEMLRQGLIDQNQAKNHPDRNIITHAVGTRKEVFVDTSDSPIPLQIGDCFLLCSDGLYDLVDETEMIHQVVTHAAQPACQELVRLANGRGGHDNISVIIVKILKMPADNKKMPITRV
ncbi:protein serine/threonine phosphatase [Nitrosomonas sp. Is79A3]|uniref:Stp1/IreP family PP2C-type Ser/Thr phosphatase n=1 Tax=Nitrosomonas sp. (strain Is79A3) TaxID=261292 RepID=UPI000215C7CF